MTQTRTVGARLRERRMDQRLRQADVAESVGISASYLNLIEHGKRRIGGKLLAQLAEVLGTDATTLTSGAEAGVIDRMRAAAARLSVMDDVDRAEDMAARYPAWARLIAQQENRVALLEAEVQALSDRLAHDPGLATALHNVISAVTSIRSTADILVTGDRVDADWQSRFHVNIHEESQRLTAESHALVSYLDRPKPVQVRHDGASVLDEAEAVLAATPAIAGAIDADPHEAEEAILSLVGDGRLSDDVRAVIAARVARMASDASQLPTAAFTAKAVETGCDPAALAEHFGVPMVVVLRRLASLAPEGGLPPMALAECDAAGALTTLVTIPGFAMQRRVPPCPLWPLFTAMLQPARPVRALVALPDASETRFMCHAVAVLEPAQTAHGTPRIQSTMLAMADPDPHADVAIPVGTTCRTCPRSDCKARRVPSVLGG